MVEARQRLYLHIGTHKTGSSSLQHYLGAQRKTLVSHGFAYFTGAYEPDNHVEFFAIALRADREAFSRAKYGIEQTDKALAAAAANFQEFRQANQKQALIVSTEGLSLLRHDDEVERLNTILGAEMLDIVPILVLRDKAAFLKSFRKQILKHADRELSNDPASINYVEQDSWLADFGAIKSLWRKHFGENALRIIDYDQAMKRDEDVLPAALKAMDLPESFIPVAGSVRLNTDTFKARIKRFLRKVGLGS
ncbi:hypothetical protein GCM10023115_03900 [Pontixanthobacter gangjinensis]|uniref:Sulfotransferase family protein n=1 Tax=Pontixanthobacter gangjinensis TaxID=1028742 RepID=A0A6I4SJ10_9SPHN|nr:hypothetical protein [Pontixanthobacter gangjinensis]MXO55643.1 hypothetical protein [Pontixanthobacter gangjinensis]